MQQRPPVRCVGVRARSARAGGRSLQRPALLLHLPRADGGCRAEQRNRGLAGVRGRRRARGLQAGGDGCADAARPLARPAACRHWTHPKWRRRHQPGRHQAVGRAAARGVRRLGRQRGQARRSQQRLLLLLLRVVVVLLLLLLLLLALLLLRKEPSAAAAGRSLASGRSWWAAQFHGRHAAAQACCHRSGGAQQRRQLQRRRRQPTVCWLAGRRLRRCDGGGRRVGRRCER